MSVSSRITAPCIIVELKMPSPKYHKYVINKQVVIQTIEDYGEGASVRNSLASAITVEHFDQIYVRITAGLKKNLDVRETLFATTIAQKLRRSFGADEATGRLLRE